MSFQKHKTFLPFLILHYYSCKGKRWWELFEHYAYMPICLWNDAPAI